MMLAAADISALRHTQDEPAALGRARHIERGSRRCEPIVKQLGSIIFAANDSSQRKVPMTSRFQLHGNMIPRTVKRMFDERSEDRLEAESQTAVLTIRGRNHIVTVLNLSRSGVMLRYSGDAHIGESVSVQLLDRGTISAQVRWLREGQMGVYFANPLD